MYKLLGGLGSASTLLLLLVGLASSAFAQISLPEYAVGAREYSPSNTCESANMCGAESEFESLGTYDFEVYPTYKDWVDGFRFALEFPDSWNVLDYELCGWSVAEGDPLDPRGGLELIADDCWFLTGPIYRVTIDCNVAGVLRIGGPPSTGYAERRVCEEDWTGIYSDYDPRVNIGDFCGRSDSGGPCSFCQQRVAGRAYPSVLEARLPVGEQELRTVRLSGQTNQWLCSSFPQCGEQYGVCFGGLESDVPWATAYHVDSESSYNHNYEVLFDAGALPEGEYFGRINILAGNCSRCDPSCIEISLTVCAAEPCPGTGACCFDNASCVVTVESSCAQQSGAFAGDGVLCSPSPCPPASSCCLDDGSCIYLTEEACDAQGGIFGPVDGDCDPVPCDSGGACCREDGTCSILTESVCLEGAGAWHSGVVVCTPYPCPPIVVAPDGTGAVASIYQAFENITDGGVIELLSGTFSGSSNVANFKGKAITLRSAAQDADSVFIDCQGSWSGILMLQGEGPDSRVEDITVIHGSESGRAAKLSGAAGTFLRCKFLASRGSLGGAVRLTNSDPHFLDCLFAGNDASASGGAIWSDSGFRLTGCTITGNNAREFGAIHLTSSDATVWLEETVIWGNCASEGGLEIGAPSGNGVRFVANCSLIDSAAVDLSVFSGDLVFEDPAFCSPSSCTAAPTEEVSVEVGTNSVCLPTANDCGVWLGVGRTGCAEVPFGSCCLELDSCRWLTEWSCEERGGVFIPNSPCEPCLVAEVCCLPSFECQLLPQPVCLAAGGESFPGVQSCGLQPCERTLVYADGSGYFPTIQAAVDASENGNIIELANGVFTGAGNRIIDPGGRAITIRSESGEPEKCVIDCRIDSSTAVWAFSITAGGPSTRIEDLKFLYGNAAVGGAVRVIGASPTFIGCVFESCSANSGGALYLSQSSSRVEGCAFRGNSAAKGGAVCAIDSNPAIVSCVFDRNVGSSQGGALFVDGTLGGNAASLTGSTFYGNASPGGSGIFALDVGQLSLERCIVAFGEGGGAVDCGSGTVVVASCSDVYANSGGDWIGCLNGQQNVSDNFSLDPMFCDAEVGDVALIASSPCAAEQSPCSQQVGALSVGCEAPSDVPIPAAVPASVFLSSPRPNPTQRASTLQFGIPRSARVELRIVDVSGRTVATLIDGGLDGGVYSVVWNGKTGRGQPVSSGVYHVVLQVDSAHVQRKLVWLRD